MRYEYLNFGRTLDYWFTHFDGHISGTEEVTRLCLVSIDRS